MKVPFYKLLFFMCSVFFQRGKQESHSQHSPCVTLKLEEKRASPLTFTSLFLSGPALCLIKKKVKVITMKQHTHYHQNNKTYVTFSKSMRVCNFRQI